MYAVQPGGIVDTPDVVVDVVVVGVVVVVVTGVVVLEHTGPVQLWTVFTGHCTPRELAGCTMV